MINNKLEVLKNIATVFNQAGITWNLGASCMLYMRGLVDDFDDIDIMIREEDVVSVKEILKDHTLTEYEPNEKYKTKSFLEYIIDGVDVDIMAGFIITNDEKDNYFPLINNDNDDLYIFEGVQLYLSKVETWLTYYQLMERKDKVEILRKKVGIQ